MNQQTLIQALPGGESRFLPCYPGAKSKQSYRDAIFNGRFEWHSVVEPFCGTGATALYARAQSRFLGEAAHDVNAIWQAWLDGEWPQLRNRVRWYQQGSPDTAWDAAWEEYHNPGSRNGLAAASLVLRKLCFGGVLRTNSRGRLNVTWSPHKVAAFRSWYCHAPEPMAGTVVTPSWQTALEQWSQSDPGDSLVLIDPPYWDPGSACTASYGNHSPQSVQHRDDCINAAQLAANQPSAKRIVVCNYASEELHWAMTDLAAETKRSLLWQDFGRLNQMNNAHGDGDVKLTERFWILE